MSFWFENGGLDQHKSRPDLRLHLKGNNHFTAAVLMTSSYLGIHGLASLLHLVRFVCTTLIARNVEF
jgi:hypothetical protein